MLLCFFLAATFWTLNSLNKTYYNVRINYPIEFVYNPERFVPLIEPPKEVVINVTGKGWKLLRKTLDIRIRPVRIELPNRIGSNYLTNRQLRPYVNAALSSLVLNYIVTDTVYFNFEPLVKRPLNLSLDTVHTFLAHGYALDGPVSIQPNKVVVSGPASLVKAMPDPFPVHIPDSMLNQHYEKQIPLAFIPQELVRSKTKQVKVAFNVKPLPFKEVEVPVTFLPSGKRKRNSPETSVKVRYQLAGAVEPISSDSFEIVADLSKINSQDSTVAVKLRKKPSAIKTVQLVPQKVKINL